MNRTATTRGKQQRGLATQAALLEAAGRVFARQSYQAAKLKDISEEAGISLGSLYFHFGNKEDIAGAVLRVQQERMSAVLDRAEDSDASALSRLLAMVEGLARLISSDALVQAGIRLLGSLPENLQDRGAHSYESWVTRAHELIEAGRVDGSITSSFSDAALAELVNEIFIGAQVRAEMRDQWASLPELMRTARPMISSLLAPPARP